MGGSDGSGSGIESDPFVLIEDITSPTHAAQVAQDLADLDQ